MKRLTIMMTAVIILAAMGTIPGAIGEGISLPIGAFGMKLIGDRKQTDEALFQSMIYTPFECNDWDLLGALEKWKDWSDVQLIEAVDNTTLSEYSESYTFSIHVEDAIVDNTYTVKFDLWCNRAYEEGEYYSCEIITESIGSKIDGVKWVSRSNSNYTVAEKRPDGKVGMTNHIYMGISWKDDGWVTKYSVVSLLPTADEYNDYEYGYKIDFGYNGIYCFLYPDGILYFWGGNYYPEGMEEQLKSVSLTSGNALGTTSSNMFNGGYVAVEEDMMAYVSANGVYRKTLDGSDEMCLLHGEFMKSVNLINGECYFAYYDVGVFGYDLNGNRLLYIHGDMSNVIADAEYVYFACHYESYDMEHGVYCYNINDGILTKLSGAQADNIAVDGEWVYYDVWDSIYRVKKDGTSRQTVLEDGKVGSFIVQDGYVLSYCYDNNDRVVLCLRKIQPDGTLSPWEVVADHTKFGGSSEYGSTGDNKYISVKDGWLYYYHASDDSMICRMALDGSVNEEFVCYTEGRRDGIYIFDDLMYLRGGSSLSFATVLE